MGGAAVPESGYNPNLFNSIEYLLQTKGRKAEYAARARKAEYAARTWKPTCVTRAWKPAAAVIICCICIWNVLLVCAANIPAFYRIIEAVSPEIADLFVPVEESSISQGIVMQVEAVKLDGNQAEMIISFRDEAGFDKINGTVDLFDNYGLESYTGSSWLGGCSFIQYDAETDKAYFMISLESEEPFDRNKLVFYVNSLIRGITREERGIDLSAVQTEAETKSVVVSGTGGAERHEDYSVSWSETVGDANLMYYEFYYFGPFSSLDAYRMYGIFHGSGELIEGEWNVTFRLEP